MQKGHLGVILESIDSKFNLVLEGHDVLRQEIREEAVRNEERFKLVDFKFEVLNKKIDAVATDLKATDERLNSKIDSVEERLTKKIDAVAADLKATDEGLNNKIDSVEERLTKKIDDVAADLKAHRADTEAHGNIYRVKES